MKHFFTGKNFCIHRRGRLKFWKCWLVPEEGKNRIYLVSNYIHFNLFPTNKCVLYLMLGFPSSAGKESACNVGDLGSIPGYKDPLKKGKATHSSILAGESHWLYSPWGHKESDMTERLSLSLPDVICVTTFSQTLSKSLKGDQPGKGKWKSYLLQEQGII